MSQSSARGRASRRRRARRLQPDGDVFQRGLPGKQRVGLEQVAGLPVERGKRRAENVDAAGGRRQQPGRDVEQRGLAAAGRPDNGDEFAVGDLERRALDRGVGAAAGETERHRHLAERHRRCAVCDACCPHYRGKLAAPFALANRRRGFLAARARAIIAAMDVDTRFAEALARLPDYLGSHVLVSVTALALGLGISLPLAILSIRRPVLRAGLLTLASIVQTIPGLALLALFYPLLLALAALSERLFGAGFSALGFLPSVLALALYSMLPVLRNTVTGLAGVDPRLRDAARVIGMTPGAVDAPDRTAAGDAGDHGRHPHRCGLGDRHRHAVDADRPDQPGQLHLRRIADAELGVRAVRLRRRRGAGARGRSIAGADGARRRRAQARAHRRRRHRPGAAGAGRAVAELRPRASALCDRRQAVQRAIRAGGADRAAPRRARPYRRCAATGSAPA